MANNDRIAIDFLTGRCWNGYRHTSQRQQQQHADTCVVCISHHRLTVRSEREMPGQRERVACVYLHMWNAGVMLRDKSCTLEPKHVRVCVFVCARIQIFW